MDGAKEVEMLLVGELRSPLFAQQLRQFVEEVHRVKEAAVASRAVATTEGLGGLAPSLFDVTSSVFKAERAGDFNLPPSERRMFRRRHALVVGALFKKLQQRFKTPAWVVANDQHRDLMLVQNGQLQVLFEIKTAATTQNVATALGQLLLYGAAVAGPLRRVMVLPEPLKPEAEKYLKEWGIECMYFDWDANEPCFQKLPSLLKVIAAAASK